MVPSSNRFRCLARGSGVKAARYPAAFVIARGSFPITR
jgi:hypothetical protein